MYADLDTKVDKTLDKLRNVVHHSDICGVDQVGSKDGHENLQEVVDKQLNDKLTKLREDFDSSMEDLVSQFSTKFTEFTTNVKLEDNRVSSHSSRLHVIEDKLFDIDCRVIECEQYPRRENVVISGIPNSVRHDELKETIVDICNQIGVNITQYDIAACHRLPNGRSRWPANTIVRFYSRDHAELCLTNRERVKSFHFRNTMKMNLRIFENLSPRNNECLRIAKWLQNENLISSYFLRNGFVKVIFSEGENPIKIRHPTELRKKFSGANIP